MALDESENEIIRVDCGRDPIAPRNLFARRQQLWRQDRFFGHG
jgi:hypothetical protein